MSANPQSRVINSNQLTAQQLACTQSAGEVPNTSASPQNLIIHPDQFEAQRLAYALQPEERLVIPVESQELIINPEHHPAAQQPSYALQPEQGPNILVDPLDLIMKAEHLVLQPEEAPNMFVNPQDLLLNPDRPVAQQPAYALQPEQALYSAYPPDHQPMQTMAPPPPRPRTPQLPPEPDFRKARKWDPQIELDPMDYQTASFQELNNRLRHLNLCIQAGRGHQRASARTDAMIKAYILYATYRLSDLALEGYHGPERADDTAELRAVLREQHRRRVQYKNDVLMVAAQLEYFEAEIQKVKAAVTRRTVVPGIPLLPQIPEDS